MGCIVPGGRVRECENAGERRLIPLFGPDAKVTCKKETLNTTRSSFSVQHALRADETFMA